MSELAEQATAAVTRLRVPKIAELVADHLRRQIVRGELREGESLPSEAALTERYGVSRPTLREAFRVLETERLITVRRGARGGATVHEPNAATVARYAGFVLEHAGSTLVEVCEARVQIEAPCARLAAERRTPADVAALRELVSKCELVGHDHQRFVVESSDFHALLVEIAGNRTLSLLHSVVRTIIDMAKFRRFAESVESSARSKAFDYGARAHSLVVDHIEAGDGDAAEALWRRHLNASNRLLLELPGSDTPLDLAE
jgi:GntR family transcriptional regulator, transcriptional repressor for pyruvate dehydrogenase complex